jgi:hypothetical protein
MILECVSHCFCYDRLLAYHLSAFALHPPERCRVQATIYFCTSDKPTCETLDYFARLSIANVTWQFRELEQSRLCRRAIGRNHAALASTADYVLYSDVDYLFGPGALDAAAEQLRIANTSGPAICYPQEILVSGSQEAGDVDIERVTKPGLYEIDATQLVPRAQPRAIGGSMWVPGEFCRQRGYLSDCPKWQRPAGEWKRTFCDTAFRGWSGLPSRAIPVPNVWRIRHSAYGRTHRGCRN